MDFLQIMTFMAVAALLVVSPGPNGMLIAKTVPVNGKPAGFANIAGFIAAFYVHGCLSILGISILLVQSSQAFFVFKMLGAAYLCWVGLKSLYSACKNNIAPKPVLSSKRVALSSAFIEGFLTNGLNPKVSMFYLAAFPQFIPVDGGALVAFSLVTLHVLINTIWFSTMVILLANFKRISVSTGLSRSLKVITGLVFVGFAAKLASLKGAV
jgi:threonine/homoserine/homoserine lactone efflux protein